MRLIDAHCHLEATEFADPLPLIERAKQGGVVHAVVVGQLQKPGDFGSALALSRRFPDFLTPNYGIHPHDAAAATEADWAQLEALCALPEVKAVGECGFDFFYNHSPPDLQAHAFRRQCQISKRLKKPIVLHVRDAHPQCLELLKSEGIRDGMVHCFTGDTDAARQYLDLGFRLSISGVVTYKKSEALQAAVQFAPIDRLMVETDTPFLAPVPYRGKKNEPAWVKETALKIASLRSIDPEVVADACSKTTTEFFCINVSSKD
jgi:TatD DNase family protein